MKQITTTSTTKSKSCITSLLCSSTAQTATSTISSMFNRITSTSLTMKRSTRLATSAWLLLALLLCDPMCTSALALSSFTTAKPGVSMLNSAASALSSAAASNSGSSSSSSGSGGGAGSALLNAASQSGNHHHHGHKNKFAVTFLKSLVGVAANSASSGSSGGGIGSSAAASVLRPTLTAGGVANPYPIRTMIGNLYFRLQKHKTPIMIIPPLLRLVYQYRAPIMSGLSTAFKSVSGAGVAKGAAEAAVGALGAAASNPIPSIAAAGAAGALGAAGSAAGAGNLLFPGPFALPGAAVGFPGMAGVASPLMGAFAPAPAMF